MDKDISFTVSKEDDQVIIDIVTRAVTLPLRYSFMDCVMDITATHANGTPLKLGELLAASEQDFIHDVIGIRNNLNRESGELENCFLPRFAKGQAEREAG